MLNPHFVHPFLVKKHVQTSPSAPCRDRDRHAEMLCLGAAIDGMRQARAELQVLRAHALSILARIASRHIQTIMGLEKTI